MRNTLAAIGFMLLFCLSATAGTYESIKDGSWDKSVVLTSTEPASMDIIKIHHNVIIDKNVTHTLVTILTIRTNGSISFDNASLFLPESSSIDAQEGASISDIGKDKKEDKDKHLSKIAIGSITWDPDALGSGPYNVSKESLPLPVTLINFQVKEFNNDLQLSWLVAMETNVSHYEVQMSDDGRVFNTVETVNSLGDTSTKRYYGTTFSLMYRYSSKTIYFRLKVVDLDGTHEIFMVRTVRIKSTLKSYSIERNELHIFSERSELAIIDLSGRPVVKATDETTVNLTGLSGIYIIILNLDDKVVKEKIML
jgi:hypothetical protein